MAFNWTAEAITELLRLVAEGRSASVIADRMGCGLTRNAVIGKVGRLREAAMRTADTSDVELPRLHSRDVRKAKKIVAHANRKPRMRKLVAPLIVVQAGPPLILPPPLAVEPEPREPITLINLRGCTCRWPMWQSDTDERLYCGEMVKPTSAYCPAHAAIASTPVRGRPEREVRKSLMIGAFQ